MARAAERARVQAMVGELLGKLRSTEADPKEIERHARAELARVANNRALARHGRPLIGWCERWEREREARNEQLTNSTREADSR